MKMPRTRPATENSRPSPPKPKRPSWLPKRLSTSSIMLSATMPNIAAITKVRNFWPTLMLKNLYAASVPANAANVPRTAWTTMPPYCSLGNAAS